MIKIQIKVKSQEEVNIEEYQEMEINGKFLLWLIKKRGM